MASKQVTENHLKTGGEVLEYANKVTEIPNSISEECVEKFQELKLRRKHRYIVYRIGESGIEVERLGGRKESYEEFKSSLPYTDCRYCIYDQDYKTSDGRPASKLWFICWFPENSNTYNKMAYTSAKANFNDATPGVFDTQVSSLEQLDFNLGYAVDEDEDDTEIEF
eukprot:gene9192-12397_t